jgi:hypothetical protein
MGVPPMSIRAFNAARPISLTDSPSSSTWIGSSLGGNGLYSLTSVSGCFDMKPTRIGWDWPSGTVAVAVCQVPPSSTTSWSRASGLPTSWSLDPTAIDAEAATDGWYALLTTLPADIDATQVLIRYKGQEVVERRYSAFKGPLAVAPMFLKTNRRITALITVICLALLIFCLIERATRTAIVPETRMTGLTPGQKAKPTGRLILQALAGLRLIPATAGQPAIIPQPTPTQARLLDLLAVDPTRPP